MIVRTLAMRRRGRSPRCSEAGYALVAVLAMLAICSILVLGLLSLVLLDANVARMAHRGGATARAIDGALEVATNVVKTSAGGVMGRANNPCDPVPSITLDDTEVQILCTPLPGPRSDVLPTTEGPAVTLLGPYTTPLADADAALAKVVADGIIGSIADQLGDVTAQVQASLRATGPGLIALGPQPLRIDGDLRVRTWSLAQRLNGAGVAVSPSMQITGRYSQGDLGPLGGIGFYLGTTWIGTPPCGIFDPDFPLDFGVRISASLGRKCGLGRSHTDFADTTAPIAMWDGAKRAAEAKVVPAACATWALPGSPSVIVIPPGSYGFTETATLNKWFSGSCRNVTFHFPPGDYYFDVSGGDGSTRGALRFGDRTDRWVFGTPKGWDPAVGGAPATAFPAACDPTADGATVTLSSRTTLQHYDGLVAMCGRSDAAGVRQTVYQEQGGLGSTKWATAPTTAVGGLFNASLPCATNPANPSFGAFENGQNAVGSSTMPAALTDYPTAGAPWDSHEAPTALFSTAACSTNTENQPQLELSGFHAHYSGSLVGLKLRVLGTSSRLSSSSRMRATITSADGKICRLPESASLPVGSSSVKTYAFDLTGFCSWLNDGARLEDATLTLNPRLVRSGSSGTASLSLDHVWLEATTTNGIVPSAFSTWVDPDGGRGMWLFGKAQLPNSGVNVNWWGSASNLPIFGGGLVAQGLASWHLNNSVQVGVLASPSVQPASRRVLLRAVSGGRLRGSAILTLDDASLDGTHAEFGRLLGVDDWRFCNEALPTDGVDRPCPAPR